MKNAGFEKLTIVFVVGLVFWSSSAARAGELTDAVKADDPQRIQALISGGADVNELDRFGTPLHMAVARGSVEIARVLIDAGADLEAEGSLGARPLHTAALGNQAAVAALLIERGAEVDTRDSKGMTPLIVAASYGHVEIAELLLNSGADPRLEDEASHWTAIHYAAFNGHLNATKLLLSKGVDVDLRGAQGETPLYLATRGDRWEMLEFLLANGADPNIPDNAGKTAIQLPISRPEIRDLLRKFGAKE